MIRISIIFAVMVAGLAAGLPVLAGDGVPLPQITRGKGEACVDDPEFMRRNHMDLLRHERDETVHEGDRDTRYSLKACIACHAVNGPEGQPVRASSPQHFCSACHNYAAVSIDCFQCHASTPAPLLAGGGGMDTVGAGDSVTGMQWK